MDINLSDGSRLPIPDGCTAFIDGNEIVIEKKDFKRGDVITNETGAMLLVSEFEYGNKLTSIVHSSKGELLDKEYYAEWNANAN